MQSHTLILWKRIVFFISCLFFAGCELIPLQPKPTPTVTKENSQPLCDCPEPKVLNVPKVCPSIEPKRCPTVVDSTVTGNGDLRIVGQIEYVDIMSLPMRKKARIDTGAATTSIDASNITEFERDGKKWVMFDVVDRESGNTEGLKAAVVRTVLIKRQNADSVRRPVIRMDLRMGSLRDTVEVNLADRDNFDYPLLIGRNFLQGQAVVDVSRKYVVLGDRQEEVSQ